MDQKEGTDRTVITKNPTTEKADHNASTTASPASTSPGLKQSPAGQKKSKTAEGKGFLKNAFVVLVAIVLLCSNIPWGKTSKGISIYLNQHAEHTCESVVSRIYVAQQPKICAIFDITNYVAPELVQNYREQVKAHYTLSGSWFSSGTHGKTRFANEDQTRTLMEFVLPTGTLMASIGSLLTLVANVILSPTNMYFYGTDAMVVGSFLVAAALGMGTPDGLSSEGIATFFAVAVARACDSVVMNHKASFFSYPQMVLYSIALTVVLLWQH
jgi:hypothetical protein